MDSSSLSNTTDSSHTPSSVTLSLSSSPPACKMGVPAVALLPPELLCNMFEAYKDAEPHSRPVRCRDRVPEWIAVLHVCRAWRLAASSCPSLWTRLDFSSAEWTNIFLSRSRNFPLHVDADFSSVAGPDSVRAARAAMTHMHRIRELSIKADDRLDIHEIMRTYTRFPAPSLQSLVFSCPAYSMSFVPYFFQELFCGQTPALRVLRVKNASFEPDMTSHLVRNLTHFEMTGAMSWRWFSKMRDFHSMLGASPHLQSLMLEYSIPSERSVPPDGTPPSTPSTPDEAYTIELPSLRIIKIQDYSRSLRNFLEHLAIPPSTSIHLSMNTDDTETDASAQGGITSLVSGIRIDPISTIRTLHFDVRQSELHIRGWKQHEVPKNRSHWPHETLRLMMDGYSRYLINGTLMQSITGALPLSEVQYLRADLHEPLERPVWQHLLWRMRGIEDAVVMGTITTHEFIECLGLAPEVGDSPDDQRAACCIRYNLPLLERVTLLRIDVDDEWYECLVEGLLSRRRLGAPKLKWLHIEPSKPRGLDGSYFEQLEDAVSVVTLSTLEQSAWS